MKEFEKIRNMLHDADTLKRSNEIYAEKIKEPSCDKHGFSFSENDKFLSIKLNMNLISWRGFYGNSGCTTIFSFRDEPMVKKAFEEYLNIKRNEILKWMGDYIYDQAMENKQKAECELKESLEYLENLNKTGGTI